ncbi:MAG: hypothetical protein GX811_12880 [Lentisphaerae bacterium]|nr:hypothetical protein [Lentisphaerota bacterium]
MSSVLRLFRKTLLQVNMDFTHPSLIALSKELRILHEMPISSKEERDNWYLAAQSLQDRIRKDWTDIEASLPHELYHYFSDADIRATDEGYRRYLEELLRDLLFLE